MALLWSLGTFSQTAVVVLLLCCVDANFLCMLGVLTLVSVIAFGGKRGTSGGNGKPVGARIDVEVFMLVLIAYVAEVIGVSGGMSLKLFSLLFFEGAGSVCSPGVA